MTLLLAEGSGGGGAHVLRMLLPNTKESARTVAENVEKPCATSTLLRE